MSVPPPFQVRFKSVPYIGDIDKSPKNLTYCFYNALQQALLHHAFTLLLMLLWGFEGVFYYLSVKNIVKNICNTVFFCNFVLDFHR